MKLVRNYLADQATPADELYRSIISLAMLSHARTCIVPMQDLLGLDNDTRMNMPGTVDANWSWRLAPGQVTEALGDELLAVTMRYGRANWDALNAKNEK